VELKVEENLELLLDQIADALVGKGYIVLDSALPESLVYNLISHLDQLEVNGLKAAGIGRGRDLQQKLQIRGDTIQWLSNLEAVESEFLDWMDRLRVGLNQRLYAGLADYEGHFAVYPVGAFYQKHLDTFRDQPFSDKPTRKISSVLYLNSDWKEEDGGELLLYDESGDEIVETIAPECGKLVVFLSEKFPHGVNAAKKRRRSIPGWFRSR